MFRIKSVNELLRFQTRLRNDKVLTKDKSQLNKITKKCTNVNTLLLSTAGNTCEICSLPLSERKNKVVKSEVNAR